MGERKTWWFALLTFTGTGMFTYPVAANSFDDIKANFSRLPMSTKNPADSFVDIKTSSRGLPTWTEDQDSPRIL